MPAATKMFRVRGCFLFVLMVLTVAVTSAWRLPRRARQLSEDFETTDFTCTSQGQYAYIVSVRDKTAKKEHLCGGVLIAKNAVLTAAHCVDPRANQKATTTPVVYIGGEQRNNPIQVRQTVRAFPHPDWTGSEIDGNDIVVLKLNKPSCIWRIPQLGAPDATNRDGLTFLGYGRGSEGSIFAARLQIADFTTFNNTFCDSRYEIIRPLHENELCARGRTDAGLCSGDSGGPMIRRPTVIRFKDVVIGIASFSSVSCTESQGVSVFTEVYKYRKWIESEMKSKDFKNAT